MNRTSVDGRRSASRSVCFFAIMLLMCLLAVPALAIQPIQPGQEHTSKLSKSFIAPELEVQPDLEPTTNLAGAATMKPGVAAFMQRQGGSWEMRWDRRSDRPNLIQGSGIALIPGSGNTLAAATLGLSPSAAIEMPTVEALLRKFISENHDLLQTAGMDFRLNEANSVPYGEGREHWFIQFDQYQDGVRVDGANLFFRISHGNIVQFGSNRVTTVAISVKPATNRKSAFANAWKELGFPAGTVVADTVEAGELLVLPVDPLGQQPGESYAGMDGNGYAHRLAWRFVFRVNDDAATYEVLVDAQTDSVIEVRDLNEYAAAAVSGGIYATTNTDAEVVKPMPFVSVSNGTTKITDVLGMYDYGSGSATTTLNGKYFKMSDGCGSISLTNSTDGNLALGSSGGTDCTTPGVGGAGNTHASRTGFYHLTNINRKAATFFPSNSWLASTVTANMNVNDVCNAFWNGSSLNFFKSGSGCSNTGEIAAVFLHEWGHGMDTNTGGSATEYGSGEAVGDTFAFLETKDACIGKNFKPGVPCYNCNTSCTGVRDVAAFSTLGAATIAKPSTITSTSGPGCARWACPYSTPQGQAYRGPMGYEGHCESYIASSANWDLSQALIEKFGTQQGWSQMDKIWYGSLVPSKSAYRVASGGQCNVAAQVDGCGANNWYTVYLAADDDDGNLANGTPNACRIWDAFNAHGIACGTRPVCSADAPDFTLTIPNPSQGTCVPGSATYAIQVGSQMSFSNPVTLSASGLPAGVSAGFSPNPVTPGSSSTLTLTASAAALAGPSTVTVNGSATASPGHAETVQLTLSVGQPAVPVLTFPANGASGTQRQPVFTWAADAAAVNYTIEIAGDAAFATIVETGTPSAATYTPTAPLAPMTTYYWRVRANSPCGNSAVSTVSSFTTGITFPEPYCAVTFPSAVEPITRVKFTGIDNLSSAAVGGSPALEDFLGVTGGAASPGSTYAMTVEGNTAGSYTTKIKAYIDWNHNGVFDASEGYVIGDLINSTGVDGKQVTANVAVPAGALSGPTRMRVIKKYNTAPAACETAGYGQAEDYTLQVGSTNPTYTVGGTVSGLAGSGLTLKLNGGTALPVAANGAFTFPDYLTASTAYAVTIGTQPSGQSCAVANGSGTIGSANVTNVAVTCATVPTYTVGGTVTGLSGSGLTLKLNGGSALPVAANGAFTFPDHLPASTAYAVAIGTQPVGQACTVANGSGAIGSANVTNVAVSCANAQTYTVGGAVSGLAGSGLTLKLNGGSALPVAADGAFTFPDNLTASTAYVVTIGTQPSGQICTVANGSGTIGSANVTNVAVACATPAYTVGGSVSGLVGSGLTLKLNGGSGLSVAANGAFTFPDNLATSTAYAVTIGAQPSSPAQNCMIANGSGTIGSANVTNVTVTCVTPTYTVGGTVSGLAGSGLTLKLNGGTALSVAADGAFTFPDNLGNNAAYAVTVGTQPAGQACTVANGSGTIGAANVTDVAVSCVTPTFTVGGTVTGLVGSGLKLKLNNGSNLVISGNGAFAFTTQLATGASYVVAVTSQPSDQTCTIANDIGTIGTANVTDVAVTCATSITDRIFADGFEQAGAILSGR